MMSTFLTNDQMYASADIQFDQITQVWVKRIFFQNLQTHRLKSEKYKDLKIICNDFYQLN